MRFKRIYIEITNVCNLQCSFCPPHHREKRFMNFAEFQHILQQIKPYTQYIYLHVKGEPLLHPEIDSFILHAYKEGFFINLTTNGTLLHEHLAITHCLRQINLSLHATNSQEIVNVAKGIHDTILNYRIWNQSINEEAIALLEKNYATKIPPVPQFTLAPHTFVSQAELFEWPDANKKESNKNGYCYALQNQIAILVDGTVVPCCFDHNGEISLGNILQQDFSEILSTERCLAIQKGFQNRIAIEPLCQKCTYKERF